MTATKTIAIIGATGHLALPVVKDCLHAGYKVKAIVRNPNKAKVALPHQVTIVSADLANVSTLIQALSKVDVVYINLSMENICMDMPFYTEREGIRNILEAAQFNGIQQILKIGALCTYPYATHIRQNSQQSCIQIQGHRLIERSGIPFTIFHPSPFIDNFFWNLIGTTSRWIGRPTECYWTNSADYAHQVVRAIGNTNAMNKHYAVQGTERLTYIDLEKRLKISFHPHFMVKSTPLWIINTVGLWNSQLTSLGQLSSYFETNPENFYATTTWEDLGRPLMTVEEFGLRMKSQVAAVC